ncbi:MAG TPA: serine/threonine-protein kinase [Pyrinomonadaceae bacterium]|nr:serine/threonine-protein kinase [Pyrinomonadaceae bacterium]
MSPETWQEIKRIFDAAVDLSPSAQKAFLDSACPDAEARREVERMLAADDDTGLDRSPLATHAFTEGARLEGRRIGRYRIVGEVGRGGMGAVFSAVRDDGQFEQKVAVKVILSGLNTDAIARRFRNERQILASLEHPNIARLLDGGMSDDGLPFYVMEFIEGEPIDEYCRTRDLALHARLELFRQVCSAVSYAHRRLIVHRDIKPSNILVTPAGEVKLLDFGIAKVVSQTNAGERGTATQLGLMTPDYASPEQFRGDRVTTAADIYSLGVVLYRLLTGQLPYNLNGLRLDQVLRLVCETEPPRPSEVIADTGWRTASSTAKTRRIESDDRFHAETIRVSQFAIRNPQSLKGDLDNIVLKALKKEPDRRYESVEQFSEDVRRYLMELPVSARPDTFAYRASKFVKRNRVGVIAASVVFFALIAGIVGMTYQARAARRERERAEKRFDQVRKLANNVVFKYHDAIADLPGATATREMLVKDALEYLDNLSQDAEDNPELAQELALTYLKIGNVQGETYRANLGDSAGAIVSYQKSVEILESLTRKDAANIAYVKNLRQAAQQMALLLVRLQRWKEAEETGQRVLDISLRLVDLEPNNQEYRILLLRGYHVKGETVEFSRGDEETVEWFRKAVREGEQVYAKNPTDELVRRSFTMALQRLGTRLELRAEQLREVSAPEDQIMPLYIEAEGLHRRTVELSEALQRDFPQVEVYRRFIAATSINLGTAMARIGKGHEGVPYILRSLEILRGISEQDPKNNEAKRDVAELWQYMAFARDAMGQSGEAIKANLESLRILEEITTNDPSNFEFLKQTHLTYNKTGDILLKQGKRAEALAYYRKGVAYVDRMSKLNDNTQIAVLRSESNRKVGEALLAIAAAEPGGNSDALAEARSYLLAAQEDLLNLARRNELGKNYEHRLNLISSELARTAPAGSS